MGISAAQALDCFNSDDLIGIGMEADAVRRALHPEGVVSYVVDRRIVIDEAALANFDSIYSQALEAIELGGTGVWLELAAEASLEALETILAGIRARAGALWLHGLSATAVVQLASGAGISVREALLRLKVAGLDSLAGEDAGILDLAQDPGATTARCESKVWLEVHRTAHAIGLRSTAAMVFGAGETVAQRVAHLEAIQALQAETGGFTSFVPLAFRPKHAGEVGADWEPATAVEYLRTLAISRMVLDGIPHIESRGAAQGLKVVQMALRFGSNDVGSVSLEEDVRHRKARGSAISEEDLRRVIRDAGFRPAQRDTGFQMMYLNN